MTIINRRVFISAAASTGALAAIGGVGASTAQAGTKVPASDDKTAASHLLHVSSATAITEVFGDGQKLTAVALHYDTTIDGTDLSRSAFNVVDRTITNVYTSHHAATGHGRHSGRYVIVELSTSDAAAALWVQGGGGGMGGGGGGGGGGMGGPPQVGDSTPGGKVVPASAVVTQTGNVTTTRGHVYYSSTTALKTTKVKNLIVDDFDQLTFTDPVTGRTLHYNLFKPKGYSRHKSYPMVLFMHDAGVVNSGTLAPLAQGLGAVCWASPEDQARNECFVLAPEYPEVVIGDDYKPSTYFEATVALVHHVADRYSIDKKRLYTTGQSMGAMISLGLNIRYPDLFAAAYIVAGQWPAEQALPLAKKKLFIAVSQGDAKAYPGMNAVTDVIRAAGTKVVTATWNGDDTARALAVDVKALLDQRAPVNYASFAPHTVPGSASGGGSEHTGTWRVAYSIPDIRHWIMKQKL